jgi:hypothetical protein
MSKKKSNYSPYCKLCSSCGVDGCCSHINCFSTLVLNPKCNYGRTYIKDAILNHKINEMVFNLFIKLEKDEKYTKEQFILDFNLKYDELLDKRFSKDEFKK